MSRLYYKHMMGEDTIGYYSNGEVYKNKPEGLLGDTNVVLRYNGNNILKNGEIIAVLDDFGNIRQWLGWGGVGDPVAAIQNGVVYLNKGNGWESTLATYDGDIYGAAAAVVAFMLNLGGTQAGGTQTGVTTQGSGAGQSSELGCLGILGIIFQLIIGILVFMWKAAPIIPIVFLFGIGDAFLAIMYAGIVLVGWLLLRSNKKKPALIKRLFAEGMMNGAWVLTPMILGFAPVTMLIGVFGVVRIILPVVIQATTK